MMASGKGLSTWQFAVLFGALLTFFILGVFFMIGSAKTEKDPEGLAGAQVMGAMAVWSCLVFAASFSVKAKRPVGRAVASCYIIGGLFAFLAGLFLILLSFSSKLPMFPSPKLSLLTGLAILAVIFVIIPLNLFTSLRLPKDLNKLAGSFSVERGAKVAGIGISVGAASGPGSGGGKKGGGKKSGGTASYEQFRKWFKYMWIVVGLMIFFIFFNPIVVIPAGYVGVIYNAFGGIDFDTIMTPGWNLRVPVLQNVHKIYVERHTVSLLEAGGNDIEVSAPTKEGLVVEMDVTVLFKMKPERAPRVVQELSTYYVAGTIIPEIRSVSREITGDMSVTELYGPGREKMENKIFDGLKPLFERDGFIIEDVLIRKLDLPQTIVTAIEQKQATEQAVLQKQFEVDLAKKEAERKKIEAEGIANYKIEVAKGEADALRQVAQAIKDNPDVLKSKQLDVTQDLYKNPNVKWVLPANQLIYPLNLDTGASSSTATAATQ